MGFKQTPTHRFGKGSYHQIGLVRGQFGGVPEAEWLKFIAEAGFDGWEEASWELPLRRCDTDEGAAAYAKERVDLAKKLGLEIFTVSSLACGLASTATVLVLIALRTPPAFPDDPSVSVSLRWLTGDRFMWVLAALVFIGMGTYNAVATWLQPILAHFGEGGAAGNLIAVMTFAGIIGAAVLPTPISARNRRREMLLAALVVSAVSFVAIAFSHNIVWIGAWLFAEGFLLLASLPVVLDWSDVHAGPERQGAAVGFLMMAGNLGGLLLVLLVQALIGNPYLALGALAVVAVAGLPVVFRLPTRPLP